MIDYYLLLGCGKSWVAKQIFSDLSKSGKTCFITCTTGMATHQYPAHLNPTTIHHYCGISDGRFTNDRLLSRLMCEEYKSVTNRIKQTDVLGIDEIGMLSMKDFEQIEFICRYIASYYYAL